MRNNLPVTQKERTLEAGRILLSRTDLDSRIVFANSAFVNASGFAEAELLGQPHNMVRHPDVPEAVFGDLWTTIRSGKLWNGIVKNRAKNGDHYWVNANVTPIFSNGAVSGYTSVRIPATRQEITAAEHAYAMVRRNPKVTARLMHPGRSFRGLLRWSAAVTLLGLCGAGAGLALGAPVAAAAAMLATAAGIAVMAWAGFDLIGQIAHCEELMMRIQADGAVHRRLPVARSREVTDLARSFNALMAGFQAMAGDIQRSSHELHSALSGLAQSNLQIRESSEQQTQATETTAAAVEEVTVSIGEVAHRTAETANVGREALQLASSGNQVAEQAAAEIGFIAQAIDESAARLDELGRRSGEIARIVGVIREIADQTNLLALNAAIEAARAGEQGRGFAVVADEVRKLAQRTAQATTEITDVTEVIQNGTTTAVTAMHSSVERVQRGVQLTRDAAAALDCIHKGSQQTATALGEIEAATREQGLASAEIAQQVERISQMTAKNNEALQQNLAVVSGLEQLSAQLSDAANRFRADGR